MKKLEKHEWINQHSRPLAFSTDPRGSSRSCMVHTPRQVLHFHYSEFLYWTSKNAISFQCSSFVNDETDDQKPLCDYVSDWIVFQQPTNQPIIFYHMHWECKTLFTIICVPVVGDSFNIPQLRYRQDHKTQVELRTGLTHRRCVYSHLNLVRLCSDNSWQIVYN